MKLPDGICGLYYDTDTEPEEGDYIVSMSRAKGKPTGRAYLIKKVRRVKSADHPNRFSLKCLRCFTNDIPKGAKKHLLYWYSRDKK